MTEIETTKTQINLRLASSLVARIDEAIHKAYAPKPAPSRNAVLERWLTAALQELEKEIARTGGMEEIEIETDDENFTFIGFLFHEDEETWEDGTDFEYKFYRTKGGQFLFWYSVNGETASTLTPHLDTQKAGRLIPGGPNGRYFEFFSELYTKARSVYDDQNYTHFRDI